MKMFDNFNEIFAAAKYSVHGRVNESSFPTSTLVEICCDAIDHSEKNKTEEIRCIDP